MQHTRSVKSLNCVVKFVGSHKSHLFSPAPLCGWSAAQVLPSLPVPWRVPWSAGRCRLACGWHQILSSCEPSWLPWNQHSPYLTIIYGPVSIFVPVRLASKTKFSKCRVGKLISLFIKTLSSADKQQATCWETGLSQPLQLLINAAFTKSKTQSP